MRAIRILFYLGLLSFLSLMGLWFYSCERIASLLPQGPFEYELGALGKVKGSVHIEDVSYLGLLDGQAGVRFKLRKVEANFEGAPWMPEPRNSVLSGVAWGAPVEYEISGGLWGKSIGISMGQVDKFLLEQQVGDRPAVKFQMNFSGGGSRLDFRQPGFLLTRPEHLRNVLANWQGFLTETEELSILPLQGKVFLAGQSQPLMLLDYGNTRIHYEKASDNLLRLSGRLDIHAAYGKNFFEQIMEMQRSLGKLPATPPGLDAVVSSVQQAFLSDAKFLLRGDFEAELPVDSFVGAVGTTSQRPEAPPFSLGLEKLELEIPFILPSRRVLTGLLEFRRGNGSPLNLKLDQRIEGVNAMSRIDALLDALEKNPQILQNRFAIDLSRARKGKIETFAELEGFHGAVVMVLGALRAYNDWILQEPSTINLRVLLATPSKKLTPADLLGATAHFELDWGMAKGSGISLVADAKGAFQWKLNGKLKKLQTSLGYCSEIFKVFFSRAFFATYFSAGAGATEVTDKERSVVAFLLSDGLWQQFRDAVLRVAFKLDRDTGSTEDLDFEFENKAGTYSLNGKPWAELRATLAALGRVELARLAQYASNELKSIDPDLAARLANFE